MIANEPPSNKCGELVDVPYKGNVKLQIQLSVCEILEHRNAAKPEVGMA